MKMGGTQGRAPNEHSREIMAIEGYLIILILSVFLVFLSKSFDCLSRIFCGSLVILSGGIGEYLKEEERKKR